MKERSVMRQVKLLGLALVAVFALTVALSTAALAKPILILPTSEKERKWKGTDDSTELEDPVPILEALFGKVICQKATAEGTEEAKGIPLGLFHITFSTCETEVIGKKTKCNGEGDAAGVILSLGTWHLVFDKITPELLVATLLLPNQITFTCGALATITVLGELLCLDLEPTSSKLSHLFHCHQKEALQLETTYWTHDKEKEVKGAELKCKLNSGAYAHCGELALGLIEHEVALFADI
jgi:hypothetical protein